MDSDFVNFFLKMEGKWKKNIWDLSNFKDPMVWADRIYDLESEKIIMSESCQICRSTDTSMDDQVLLCEICEKGWHTFCLNPPLNNIPEGKH